jgi:hypothetical protein
MAAGEAKRQTWKAGDREPVETPEDDGEFDLVIANLGKPGLAGWKAKAGSGKYHNRPVKFDILNTESELRPGKPKQLTEFVNTNPSTFFRIVNLANASGYDGELDMPVPDSPDDVKAVKERCEVIDRMLTWIAENGIVLRAYIKKEQYNGEWNNKVGKFLPQPEATAEAEAEEELPAEEEAPAEEETLLDEEEAPEEEPPPPPARKVAPKPAAKPAAKTATKPAPKRR